MGIPRFYRWYTILHLGSKVVIPSSASTSRTLASSVHLSTIFTSTSMLWSISASAYPPYHSGKWLLPQEQGQATHRRTNNRESNWVPLGISSRCQSQETTLHRTGWSGTQGQDQPITRPSFQVRSRGYRFFRWPCRKNRHQHAVNLPSQLHLTRHCVSLHTLRTTSREDHVANGHWVAWTDCDVLGLLCARRGWAQDYGLPSLLQGQRTLQQKHHSLRILARCRCDPADAGNEPGLHLHHQRRHFSITLYGMDCYIYLQKFWTTSVWTGHDQHTSGVFLEGICWSATKGEELHCAEDYQWFSTSHGFCGERFPAERILLRSEG